MARAKKTAEAGTEVQTPVAAQVAQPQQEQPQVLVPEVSPEVLVPQTYQLVGVTVVRN